MAIHMYCYHTHNNPCETHASTFYQIITLNPSHRMHLHTTIHMVRLHDFQFGVFPICSLQRWPQRNVR